MKLRRWNSDPFLQTACNIMAEELDWDSLDSGCLHRAASFALTVDGTSIVVAVLNRADAIPEALEDAAIVSATAQLWLYIPRTLDVGVPDKRVVLRSIDNIPL
ncbi:MAG: hypothetical protein AAF974_02465 [Cyanobacteria bacterium P01_E01_bin.34]